jgi:D-alanyl-D-alanine carboxypeptidase
VSWTYPKTHTRLRQALRSTEDMTDTAPLPLPRPLSSTRHLVAGRDAGTTSRRRGRGPSLVLTGVVVVAAAALAGWAGHLWSGSTGVPLLGAGTSHESTSGDPGATGVDGGVLPDGTTPFDVDVPGVAGLDPHLLDALQRAATAASADDVDIVVNSGWRSAAYQEQLLAEAVSQYGTPEEAARWVATPATSAHVHGDAVDVGYWDATAWLSEHGADHDLCQIYMNETWHYELRDGAATDGCPPMFRDPTDDPRMHP